MLPARLLPFLVFLLVACDSDSSGVTSGGADASSETDGASPDPDATNADVDAVNIEPDAQPDAAQLDVDAVNIEPDATPHDAAQLDVNAVNIEPDATPLDAAPLDVDAVNIEPDAAQLDVDAVNIGPDAACVDLARDSEHCGACDNPCAAGFGCFDGECVSNGCADGEREGFMNVADFPDVAACSGGWSVPGMGADEPVCERAGGDDGDNPAGAGCNVQDLCGDGWVVCADAAAFAERLPEGASCDELGPAGGDRPLYVSAQRGSNAVGLSCDGEGTNDLFGCGEPPMNLRANCDPFNRSIAGGEAAPWRLGERAARNVTEWSTATKSGPARGGVLCCRQPPEIGCADGEREGFADAEAFPAIAACSGGFAVAGLDHDAPACDRAAGDDGANGAGDGCNVQDLCADGWHVCDDQNDVADHLPDGASCEDLATDVPDRPLFLSRQRGSNAVGLSCDGVGTNDLFGCGPLPNDFLRANCSPLDRTMAGGEPAPWQLGQRAARNITEWNTVRKPGAARGGVLCCQD